MCMYMVILYYIHVFNLTTNDDDDYDDDDDDDV